MANSRRSPYLNDPNRLADVIAAIQAMATYKFYKLDFEHWADRISANKGQAEYWRAVLQQHPEFFRLDSARERASLVWRRQRQKRFDVDSEVQVSKEDFEARSPEGKARVSRSPLSAAEISTLIGAAISLHSRALEQERDARWWVPLVVAAVGAASGLTGALIGAWIKSQ